MTNEEKDKKEYELAVLVKEEGDLAVVTALVGQHKGEGVSEPRAKKLALAYEIKGETDAVFAYCTFKAFGEEVKNLERDLNTHAAVLRFMIIASPPPAERPYSSMVPHERRGKAPYAGAGSSPSPSSESRESRPSTSRPASSGPISNEALEKRIEEILQ
jgi:ribosomal protein S6